MLLVRYFQSILNSYGIWGRAYLAPFFYFMLSKLGIQNPIWYGYDGVWHKINFTSLFKLIFFNLFVYFSTFLVSVMHKTENTFWGLSVVEIYIGIFFFHKMKSPEWFCVYSLLLTQRKLFFFLESSDEFFVVYFFITKYVWNLENDQWTKIFD